MAYTTWAANKLLDHSLGVTSWTMPSTVYLALFTTAPTDAYTSGSPNGTEVSGGGYTRQAITFGSASSRASSNSSSETQTASASWGTVVAIGIFDASTNGNLIWWDGLDTNRSIGNGESYTLAIGDLDIAFSAS